MAAWYSMERAYLNLNMPLLQDIKVSQTNKTNRCIDTEHTGGCYRGGGRGMGKIGEGEILVRMFDIFIWVKVS